MKVNKLNNKIELMAEQSRNLQNTFERQDTLLKDREQELQEIKMSLNDLQKQCEYLEGLLNDDKHLSFYDKNENKYSYELGQCIYSLLSLNVSAVNVAPVIENVLKMIGKSCDKLPARTKILNMNVERLILAQKQLGEVIPDKTILTLYTDETSKFGVRYSGYHVSDQDGTMYVLGMRQLET